MSALEDFEQEFGDWADVCCTPPTRRTDVRHIVRVIKNDEQRSQGACEGMFGAADLGRRKVEGGRGGALRTSAGKLRDNRYNSRS